MDVLLVWGIFFLSNYLCRPLPTAAAMAAPPLPPSGLRTDIITLQDPPIQYMALLQLGTPPQQITVIVDTGSEAIWVQCAGRSSSSTFQPIACVPNNMNQYSCPLGDVSVATTCDASLTCNYHVNYLDQSASTGVLSYDTLTISSGQYTSQVVFGCGNVNTGIESQLGASGMLGLDRGGFSLPSQLSLTKFAYCLPPHIPGATPHGYITFGDTTVAETLGYTPMQQNNLGGQLNSQSYYLNMIGVSVNNYLLHIPSVAFQVDNQGSGGTIIDSGTTYTKLVDAAYSQLRDAFKSAMNSTSAVQANSAGLAFDLCYTIPGNPQQPLVAPSVTLHFDGGVDIQLQTNHLLVVLHPSNYYCMAFRNAGKDSSAQNVLGNYQQQNFLVEYDLQSSRIGFAPTQCSPATP